MSFRKRQGPMSSMDTLRHSGPRGHRSSLFAPAPDVAAGVVEMTASPDGLLVLQPKNRDKGLRTGNSKRLRTGVEVPAPSRQQHSLFAIEECRRRGRTSSEEQREMERLGSQMAAAEVDHHIEDRHEDEALLTRKSGSCANYTAINGGSLQLHGTNNNQSCSPVVGEEDTTTACQEGEDDTSRGEATSSSSPRSSRSRLLRLQRRSRSASASTISIRYNYKLHRHFLSAVHDPPPQYATEMVWDRGGAIWTAWLMRLCQSDENTTMADLYYNFTLGRAPQWRYRNKKTPTICVRTLADGRSTRKEEFVEKQAGRKQIEPGCVGNQHGRDFNSKEANRNLGASAATSGDLQNKQEVPAAARAREAEPETHPRQDPSDPQHPYSEQNFTSSGRMVVSPDQHQMQTHFYGAEDLESQKSVETSFTRAASCVPERSERTSRSTSTTMCMRSSSEATVTTMEKTCDDPPAALSSNFDSSTTASVHLQQLVVGQQDATSALEEDYAPQLVDAVAGEDARNLHILVSERVEVGEDRGGKDGPSYFEVVDRSEDPVEEDDLIRQRLRLLLTRRNLHARNELLGGQAQQEHGITSSGTMQANDVSSCSSAINLPPPPAPAPPVVEYKDEREQRSNCTLLAIEVDCASPGLTTPRDDQIREETENANIKATELQPRRRRPRKKRAPALEHQPPPGAKEAKGRGPRRDGTRHHGAGQHKEQHKNRAVPATSQQENGPEYFFCWDSATPGQRKAMIERNHAAGAWIVYHKLRAMLSSTDLLEKVFISVNREAVSPGVYSEKTFDVPMLYVGSSMEDYQRYIDTVSLPLVRAALRYAGLSTAYMIDHAEEYGTDPRFLVSTEAGRDECREKDHGRAETLMASGSASLSDNLTTRNKCKPRLRPGVKIYDCPFLVFPFVCDHNQDPKTGLTAYLLGPHFKDGVETKGVRPANVQTTSEFFSLLCRTPVLAKQNRGETVFSGDADESVDKNG
ncbi:unnamed protein product [Amoebophrya sp. A120]|nr:unnamed protein product [Amoebophrya sp. A120]|eukprot:GSA120T00017999001.1